MRNPYVTGPFVCGQKHYGRGELLDYLLHGDSCAYWVVGNRRIGKTSLLRQLETLATEGNRFVPFVWDMQGSESWVHLSQYLTDAICDHPDRLAALGLESSKLSTSDAASVVAALRRAAKRAGREVLLLLDETEVLIAIAQRAPKSVQRFHRELTSGGGLRVVAASTQAIYQFHDVCRDWPTSPFLAGFDMSQTLGSLSPQSARALITQSQEPDPVRAESDIVEAISEHTNNHPYLIQLLCSRLFREEGWLRPLTAQDLDVDPVLSGFFGVDLGALTQADRKILRTVADAQVTDEAAIAQSTGGNLPDVRRQVRNLERLGFLRRIYGQVAIGNQFLANWLEIEPAALDGAPPKISDTALNVALASRHTQEIGFLQARLNARRARLVELEAIRARDLLDVSPQVLVEIEQLQGRIRHLRRLLEDLQQAA